MSSAKWRPFCLDLNVLNVPVNVTLAPINIQGNRDEYDLLLTLIYAKSQREWYVYIYIYCMCLLYTSIQGKWIQASKYIMGLSPWWLLMELRNWDLIV